MANVYLHFSDFFEISPDILESYGAFNVSLINDLPVFIDPFLLFNSENPLYKELHAKIIEYVKFLRDMSLAPGIERGHLRNWFSFSEIRQNWLGYSRSGNTGRGLGRDVARLFHKNLNTVVTDFAVEEISKAS